MIPSVHRLNDVIFTKSICCVWKVCTLLYRLEIELFRVCLKRFSLSHSQLVIFFSEIGSVNVVIVKTETYPVILVMLSKWIVLAHVCVCYH